MFARFLEMTVKPNKKTELMKKVKEEILPILKTYNGFFVLIPLDVETEPTKFYAISLWQAKLDAEKYEKENFPKVKTIVEPFLTMPVVVTTFRPAIVITDLIMQRENPWAKLYDPSRISINYDALKAFVRENANVFILHSNLGLILYKQGKLDEAGGHFRRAVELAPNYAEAHNVLALARLQGGGVHAATESIRVAIQLSPRNEQYLLNLAQIDLAGKKWDDATALRFGDLALVQPILAAELLFVFGYLAVAGSRRPKLRDWLAAHPRESYQLIVAHTHGHGDHVAMFRRRFWCKLPGSIC